MTREEAEKYAESMTYRDAINNLMRARAIPYRKATFIKINELLDRLEQEPCEDAISRQAVLVTARNSCADLVSNKDTEIFCDEIKALPPVTSQSKTGRWIEESTYMECPNCHDIWHYEKNQTERFKHCPTCGGKN